MYWRRHVANCFTEKYIITIINVLRIANYDEQPSPSDWNNWMYECGMLLPRIFYCVINAKKRHKMKRQLRLYIFLVCSTVFALTQHTFDLDQTLWTNILLLLYTQLASFQSEYKHKCGAVDSNSRQFYILILLFLSFVRSFVR